MVDMEDIPIRNIVNYITMCNLFFVEDFMEVMAGKREGASTPSDDV